jgi:hypothetical protein
MIDLFMGNSRLASTGIRARSCCLNGGKVCVSHGWTVFIDQHSQVLASEPLVSERFLVIFALLSLKRIERVP